MPVGTEVDLVLGTHSAVSQLSVSLLPGLLATLCKVLSRRRSIAFDLLLDLSRARKRIDRSVKHCRETFRGKNEIRNTFKHILSNIFDFLAPIFGFEPGPLSRVDRPRQGAGGR